MKNCKYINLAGLFFLLFILCPCLAAGQKEAPEKYCKDVLVVKEKGELLDAIGSLKWNYAGPYKAGGLDVSTDIRIEGILVVDSKDIPVPGACMRRDDCRHAVRMDVQKGLKGVVCTEAEEVLGMKSCTQVKISNAIIRLRAKLMDTHPWRWNFVPVLDFLPSCSEPCKAGEIRCANDGVCWKGFSAYCMNCLGLPSKRCVCLDEKGSLPDGSNCMFFISGDVVCAGKCSGGACSVPVSRDGDCGVCCR